MKIILSFFTALILSSCLALTAQAQPKARRAQAQAAKGTPALTTRAQLSFPTAAAMSDDVTWRRDIYRELDLTDARNAALYYPAEPTPTEMNLFTYIFKLMLTGQVRAYEYRLDAGEVFTDSARVRPLALLDNYHIFYERRDGKLRIENADIPSREVKSYYIKESAYYDQATSTFHRRVTALCPVLSREDDFGDGTAKYPLFWMRYDDLAPFLTKHTVMTSDLNNAAVMSADDYFTRNLYNGKIYKTNNLLGRTLAGYCEGDTALAREQARIEAELAAFEKGVYGDPARRDSLDSIANAKTMKPKAAKRRTANRRGTASASASRREKQPKGSTQSAARVSVRRERH